MNTLNISAVPASSAETLYAQRVAARLSAATVDLPHDVTERLRASREQALAVRKRTADVRVLAPANASSLTVNADGSATLGGMGGSGGLDHFLQSLWKGPLRWVAMVAPVVAMVGGLVVIDRAHQTERAVEVATVDAALLTDDLPPAAYTDPGFAQFLKQTQTR